MNNENLKRLSESYDQQHFLDQIAEILAPYGNIRRSQLLVGKVAVKPEISCFVHMESSQQAFFAKNDLDAILIGDNCLYFSVTLKEKFVG